ncbi:MAG: Ig domain-containing protein [Giesbergeria sp.]|nr:Ig domain-containing protein [Giesbergeria sp.]
MRKLFKFLALSVVTAVAACGGGGGSSGDTNLPYTIKVTAAKPQLPINLVNERVSIGAYARYTTTLYVEAREGSAPIQGGEDIFGCMIVQGLDSGALYYLDDEHEDEDGNPAAFRSITLDANSGAASFHFHAGDKAGTARITCSVTNPADKQVSSASVDIVVGAQTGQPANVLATAQAPGYLGTSTNTQNLRNNVAISALIMDDANQPVPAPSAANLQVNIRPFGASAGARLLAGSQSGTSVQVKTIGGEGQFSLSAGPSAGVILLELTTDRLDNNVSNGIQDAVMQLMAVSVHKAVRTAPLAISDSEITVTNGLPFSYALTAQGGVPPYTWSASGLPTGLTLSADGVISGTPTAPKGSYKVVVTVNDEVGPVTKNITIMVEGELAIDGCTSDVSAPCSLPAAKVGEVYSYTLSFSIGDPSVPVVWTITGNLPSGLTMDANGTISGTPLPPPGTYTFILTATRGSLKVSRQVQIVVS